MTRVRQYFAQPVPVTALSLFRISFSLLTLIYLAELWAHRHLLFDPLAYLVPATWAVVPFLVCATVGVFFVLIGLMTKIASTVAWLAFAYGVGMHSGLYHAEYMVCLFYFFMIFLPVDKNLSLSSLIRRRRAGLAPSELTTPTVPIGYYLIPVYLSLGLEYIDAVIWKFDSWHWMAGGGLWRPMSTIFAAQLDVEPLLNFPLPLAVASWSTVIFELVFFVLMWFARLRVPLALFGMAFHLGIAIAFPIPIFGLQGVLILFLLMPTWPQWVARVLGRPSRALGPTVSGLLDARWVPRFALVASTTVVVSLIQVLFIVGNAIPAWLNYRASPPLVAAVSQTTKIVRPIFGMSGHPVFHSRHFDARNRQFRIVDAATGDPLPIVNEEGRPTHLLSHDVYWVIWSFLNETAEPTPAVVQRYVADHLGPEKLASGQTYRFVVQGKYFEEAREWKPDVLRKAKAQPWQDVATVTAKNETIAYTRMPGTPRHPNGTE